MFLFSKVEMGNQIVPGNGLMYFSQVAFYKSRVKIVIILAQGKKEKNDLAGQKFFVLS